MVDLGSELQTAREEKGISLAEAEAATRIKECYLEALEANDWAALPTEVQARGFLRNYAAYLDLDADAVMSRFSHTTRSAGVTLPTPANIDSPVPTTSVDGAVFRPRDIDIDDVGGLPPWLSSDILIGVVLALVVAAVGFAALQFVLGRTDETTTVSTSEPALTPVVTDLSSQSGGENGPSLDETTAAPVTPTFDASTGLVKLDLEASEHVWVRVTVDGAPVLEGILTPESPQTWQGSQQIVLETANGAGLAAVVNGQSQGPLGDRGQAVVLAWGPNGQLAVTPAANP